MAPVRSALLIFAPDRSAPDKSAELKFALEKFTLVALALLRLALERSAADILLLVREASDRFVPTSFAPLKLLARIEPVEKSSPDKFIPLRLAPLKLPGKSSFVSCVFLRSWPEYSWGIESRKKRPRTPHISSSTTTMIRGMRHPGLFQMLFLAGTCAGAG